MNEHLCIMRRQILAALLAARPAPLTPDELVDGIPHLGDAGARELRSELQNLVTWEYLRNVNNGGAPLYRLTAAGLNQVERTGTLDPNLWGKLAL